MKKNINKSAPSQSSAQPDQLTGATRSNPAQVEWPRTIDEFMERAGTNLLAEPWQQAVEFISAHFKDEELVNVITLSRLTPHGAFLPHGPGVSQTAKEWVDQIVHTTSVPSGRAGAWVRINAVAEASGVVPVAANFRNLLLRFPALELRNQLALFMRLPFPITAVVFDGRELVEGVVRVLAEDSEDFDSVTKMFQGMLHPLPYDPTVLTPSVCIRLPGAARVPTRGGSAVQQLLFNTFNPHAFGILETAKLT